MEGGVGGGGGGEKGRKKEKEKEKENKNVKKQKLHSQQTGPRIILESAPRNTILCLFTETK